MAPNSFSAFVLMKSTLERMRRLVAVDGVVGEHYQSLGQLQATVNSNLTKLYGIEAVGHDLVVELTAIEGFPRAIRKMVEDFEGSLNSALLTPVEKLHFAELSAQLTTLSDVVVDAMREVSASYYARKYMEAGYHNTIAEPLGVPLFAPPSETIRQEILELTPPQDLAPFQYEMSETGLAVWPLKSTTEPDFTRDAAEQRAHLLEAAGYIMEALAGSNTNPHLKWAFRSISAKLEDEGTILRLGQAVLTAQAVFSADENSLMEPLAALLKDHLMGLLSYLGQFDDWNRFVARTTLASISDADEKAICDALTSLSSELSTIPTVDAAVVSSLNEAAKWPTLHDRWRDSRIRARMGTVVNLLSAVLTSVGRTVLDETRKLIALTIIAGLGSVVGGFAGVDALAWIPRAIKSALSLLGM